jgi:hypothetical protein
VPFEPDRLVTCIVTVTLPAPSETALTATEAQVEKAFPPQMVVLFQPNPVHVPAAG